MQPERGVLDSGVSHMLQLRLEAACICCGPAAAPCCSHMVGHWPVCMPIVLSALLYLQIPPNPSLSRLCRGFPGASPWLSTGCCSYSRRAWSRNIRRALLGGGLAGAGVRQAEAKLQHAKHPHPQHQPARSQQPTQQVPSACGHCRCPHSLSCRGHQASGGPSSAACCSRSGHSPSHLRLAQQAPHTCSLPCSLSPSR